ncbi:MAG: hypothetical protein GY855_06060 [candidate division Zixibacteria bacterium]|nr:hypothetical protein [candidate division Zixibacteria bacterium]
MSKNKKIDISKIRTYPFEKRATKSGTDLFAEIPQNNWKIDDFLNGLPGYLKAVEIRNLIDDIYKARQNKKACIWMMGAHFLKVGLSPIIIDLINTGFITHLALNGAGLIHDYELAFHGRTSEDVEDNLESGMFGMVAETPEYLNSIVNNADVDCNLGETAGESFNESNPKWIDISVIAAAKKAGIPLTIHVAIGSDTIHQHPSFDAAKWGKGSGNDFLVLAESCKNLNNGGVVMNIGSAVILPEVFLKALNMARNIYGDISGFSAANIDMIQHYRPVTNVVARPTSKSGIQYTLTGHFEILLPLIAWGLNSKT